MIKYGLCVRRLRLSVALSQMPKQKTGKSDIRWQELGVPFDMVVNLFYASTFNSVITNTAHAKWKTSNCEDEP